MTRLVALQPPVQPPIVVPWPEDRPHATAAWWWRPARGFRLDPDPWQVPWVSRRPSEEALSPEGPEKPRGPGRITGSDTCSLVVGDDLADVEVKVVSPPGRPLLHRFSALREADDFPRAVGAFADEFGWLGHGWPIDPLGRRYAEPVALWWREVAAVADLLRVMQDSRILKRTPLSPGGRAARDRLVDAATVLDDDGHHISVDEALAFGRADRGRSLFVVVRDLGDAVDGHWVHQRIFPVRRSAVDDDRLLSKAATLAVSQEIEHRLSGAMSVSVMPAEHRRGELRFVPTTLLGYIYLQLALFFADDSEGHLMRLCALPECRKPLQPAKTKPSTYCCSTHAKRGSRSRSQRVGDPSANAQGAKAEVAQ